ncbi:MAG: hypothetical protein ABIQ30_15265 [Devosia sp.]
MARESNVSLSQQLDDLGPFAGSGLTSTLSSIERSIIGLRLSQTDEYLDEVNASHQALLAAAELKRAVGQINVAIHALGILRCLPHILEQGEAVQSVSLGAGNTGRDFDLETDRRVGEFKFITWRGGAESIRQNSIFKDFFFLAHHDSPKRKQLFLLGLETPLRFFNGRRSLESVLSKDAATKRTFDDRFGTSLRVVRDYYSIHSDKVELVDISPWVPELVGLET